MSYKSLCPSSHQDQLQCIQQKKAKCDQAILDLQELRQCLIYDYKELKATEDIQDNQIQQFQQQVETLKIVDETQYLQLVSEQSQLQKTDQANFAKEFENQQEMMKQGNCKISHQKKVIEELQNLITVSASLKIQATKPAPLQAIDNVIQAINTAKEQLQDSRQLVHRYATQVETINEEIDRLHVLVERQATQIKQLENEFDSLYSKTSLKDLSEISKLHQTSITNAKCRIEFAKNNQRIDMNAKAIKQLATTKR